MHKKVIIEGRVEDVLHFPASRGGWVAVHPNIFHDILDLVPANAWQVVQQPDGLHILYGFYRIFSHYAEARSCFDKLSTNGIFPLFWPWPFALSLSKGGHLWIVLKENLYYSVDGGKEFRTTRLPRGCSVH